MGDFFVFLFVGFFAQLADGALGMGFGVISSSVLLFQGVTPPLVSASVNAAKIPTGLAAGISHLSHGNVDKRAFIRIAISGAIGGLIGALLLASLKGKLLTAIIAAYLLGLGILIIVRGVTGVAPRVISSSKLGVIGGVGGLIEGIGGSWGPVVSTGLLGAGMEPRRAIGSSALAELCVSVTVFVALSLALQAGHWGEGEGLNHVLIPVAGLVCGGLPAALIGGKLAAKAPRKPLTIAVGLLAFAIGVQRVFTLI